MITEALGIGLSPGLGFIIGGSANFGWPAPHFVLFFTALCARCLILRCYLQHFGETGFILVVFYNTLEARVQFLQCFAMLLLAFGTPT